MPLVCSTTNVTSGYILDRICSSGAEGIVYPLVYSGGGLGVEDGPGVEGPGAEGAG